LEQEFQSKLSQHQAQAQLRFDSQLHTVVSKLADEHYTEIKNFKAVIACRDTQIAELTSKLEKLEDCLKQAPPQVEVPV
jgi:DNA polymerase sigma